MTQQSCSHCQKLQRRVEELEALVAHLLAKLKTNSSNSSMPPSADPLNAKKTRKRKKTKRTRGGQDGHPPQLKQLLPPEQVTRTEHVIPEICDHCQAALPKEAGPEDPPPKCFQTIELPPIVLEVIEYQAHARTCTCCGRQTQATIAAELRAHSVGPRLTATLSYFSGCHSLSKRAVEEIADNVFGAPLSLGTVCNLEQEVSTAVAPAHQEVVEAVRAAEVKYADETSWKLWGKLCWLWAAGTANIAVFVIHAKRSALGLAAILGAEIYGIVHSDRWHVYKQIPAERRQLCWAHLKRDFQKVLDRGGTSAFVGRRGLRLVKEVFAAWHSFQEGKVTREQLQTNMEPLDNRMQKLLIEGALGKDPSVATFCENLLALEPALWTFVKTEGVEPTNNLMERQVRRAVLWRKRSFGCTSEAGLRFVERILTVVQTCRLRGKNTLEYLHQAVSAHRNGQPCPSLLE